MRKILIILLILLGGCIGPKNIISYDFKEVFWLYETNNMLFIEVTLNGKAAMLLIDTGASKSLLDVNKTQEYEFGSTLLVKEQWIGLGGFQDIYAVYGYHLEEFYVPFFGTDLSEITAYFERDGMPIVGILGADFLDMHSIVIDFKKNLMYKKR